jgi:hypothetical protein
MYLTPEEKQTFKKASRKAKQENDLRKCLRRYKKSGTIIRLSEILIEEMEGDFIFIIDVMKRLKKK